MPKGWSDRIRSVADEVYVQPSLRAGRGTFAISVRELMDRLKPEGFPVRNWPQICTALQAEKFLRGKGLEIERVEGPPSGQSSTVVVHYRVSRQGVGETAGRGAERGDEPGSGHSESAEERARRLTERLFGVLKEEIGELGGAEAFVMWVRSEGRSEGKEDAA